MSLIVPHRLAKPTRHSRIPFLWRASCSCGWKAYAATEFFAGEAGKAHLLEEEPFPDLTLDPTEDQH